MSKLVIVESPHKATMIKKYLGKSNVVTATVGHIRDLPAAKLSVDIKNDFAPKYAIVKGKEKLVKELKEKAANADEILLATDPDREGEAISWHLATVLGLPLDEKNRVKFNEINENAVKKGIASPEKIDMDLVDAQQARRILDRLVEYSVSSVKKGTRRRSPAPPFTTSTMQQDASRKLGFQAKRTMKIAQELYEGMEVEGFGATGLITYMRTDSLRISELSLIHI